MFGVKRRPARTVLFWEALGASQDYLKELSRLSRKVEFHELKPSDNRHASCDGRLIRAEALYRESLELCRKEKLFHDLAIVLLGLGRVLHLQGRFKEAEEVFTEALGIADSLPTLDKSGVKLITSCSYHLGILAARSGRRADAWKLLTRSLALDRQSGDLAGSQLSRRGLEWLFAVGTK